MESGNESNLLVFLQRYDNRCNSLLCVFCVCNFVERLLREGKKQTMSLLSRKTGNANATKKNARLLIRGYHVRNKPLENDINGCGKEKCTGRTSCTGAQVIVLVVGAPYSIFSCPPAKSSLVPLPNMSCPLAWFPSGIPSLDGFVLLAAGVAGLAVVHLPGLI